MGLMEKNNYVQNTVFVFFFCSVVTMENNDALRKNLTKKALPTREFFDMPIGDGYSK